MWNNMYCYILIFVLAHWTCDTKSPPARLMRYRTSTTRWIWDQVFLNVSNFKYQCQTPTRPPSVWERHSTAEGRGCSQIKSVFHFPAEGWEMQQGGWTCLLCLAQRRSQRKSSLPLLKECILWARTQEVRRSLHSCSTSRCSLWQEGLVLAAAHSYHSLASSTLSLSHYSQADSWTTLLHTTLWWLLTHSLYLWPKR